MTNPEQSECPVSGEHNWRLPEGGYVVISTNPPLHSYGCECGAFTHDPKTGAPCRVCAPQDWERRTDKLATLRGGPLDGQTVAQPLNRYVMYLDGVPRNGIQKVLRYIRSDEDPSVWEFRWNDWAVPVPIREEGTSK